MFKNVSSQCICDGGDYYAFMGLNKWPESYLTTPYYERMNLAEFVYKE